MAGERKIVGIWPNAPEADPIEPHTLVSDHASAEPELVLGADAVEPPLLLGNADWLDVDAAMEAPTGKPWLPVVLGAIGLAIVALSASIATANFTVLPALDRLPLLLAVTAAPLIVLLLIAMLVERGSNRSARRHLHLLAAMRHEQSRLGNRLAALDDGWRLAQATLADRAETLAAKALDASKTIDVASAQLETRLNTAAAIAAALAEQTSLASRHLDSLDQSLPRVDAVAQRAVDGLRSAGQTAHQAGGQLEERIAAIRSESADAEVQLTAADQRLGERLDMMVAATGAAEQSAASAAERFVRLLAGQRDGALEMLAELTASMDGNIRSLEQRLATARDAIGGATAAERAALDAALDQAEQRSAALGVSLETAVARGATLDATLIDAIDAVAARLSALESASQPRIVALHGSVAALNADLATTTTQCLDGVAQTAALAERLGAANTGLETLGGTLATTLPEAIARLEIETAQVRQSLTDLEPLVGTSAVGTRAMLDHTRAAEKLLGEQAATIAALDQASGAAHARQAAAINALADTVDGLIERLRVVGDDAAPAMLDAVERTERTATAAATRARAAVAEVMAAQQIDLDAAIGRAVDNATGDAFTERLTRLSAATNAAAAAADDAADRIDQRISAIQAATERPIIGAISGSSDEAIAGGGAASSPPVVVAAATNFVANPSVDRETLARQLDAMADALQETAVDITRLISTEVADQAWDSYLKGNRGIFARRAVRLLAASEQRAVLTRYQNDDPFRAQVNRYILDFETMLRAVLERQEGSALSVTLLSSDIGKVYVALAQSIERLRG